MVDREKVVRALDCLSRNTQDRPCNGCAYYRPFKDEPDAGWCDRPSAMADALAMLKEQEEVKPVKQIEENEWTVCGHCREHLISKWIFCPYCGREVDWND